VDGFELQFATNHLAHFLLTQLLLPTLVVSTTLALPSRVVCLTSNGHGMSPVLFGDYDQKKRGYQRWIGYGQSKTANIYLATEVERRFGSKGVHGVAVHPGFIATGLTKFRESVPLTPAEMDQMGLAGADRSTIGLQYRSIPQGAATTVWAALNHVAKGFCEDSAMAGPDPLTGKVDILAKGYAPWVVDEAAAIRLWEESINMVGL
jgi:NAD(P)-dependent dehydrogenase (short-subunit alcohol dehydrogenase family)